MSTETFVRKTAKRVIILTIILMIVIGFMSAAGTILANQIALGQMENSDLLFIVHEMYHNTVKPIVSIALTLIVGYNIATISYNTYKFIKNKNKENN